MSCSIKPGNEFAVLDAMGECRRERSLVHFSVVPDDLGSDSFPDVFADPSELRL